MTAKIRYIWSGSKKEKCTVKGETSIGEVVIWVMNSNFMSEFYYRGTKSKNFGVDKFRLQ